MTSEEYLKRYERQLGATVPPLPAGVLASEAAWAAELRQAYLLTKSIEDAADQRVSAEQRVTELENENEKLRLRVQTLEREAEAEAQRAEEDKEPEYVPYRDLPDTTIVISQGGTKLLRDDRINIARAWYWGGVQAGTKFKGWVKLCPSNARTIACLARPAKPDEVSYKMIDEARQIFGFAPGDSCGSDPIT